MSIGELILWILAVVLIVSGVIQLVNRLIVYGALSIIVGILISPPIMLDLLQKQL